MKALFKTLPVLVLAGALSVSCGKGDNKSGSSSSSGGGISGLPGNTVTQTQSYQSVDQVRSAFAQKSLSDGLTNGTEVYHMGLYFNGNYSGGGNINFSGGFCINLFGWTAGDCDNYGNGGYGQDDLLLDQLNYGVFKKVTNAGSTSVTYQKPTGVVSDNYGGYVYDYTGAQNKTFDRNSTKYKEMLGLDVPAQNILESRVSPATITMSNGQQVVGQVIELFIGSQTYGNSYISEVRRMVVSTSLPVFANPIAVIDTVYQVYGGGGYSALVSGYLGFLGDTNSQGNVQAVQSITINQLHYAQTNYGGFQLMPLQNVQIGF